MEDVFKDLDFVIVYVDNLLVFSLDMKQHKQHLEQVYDRIYKHGISLSKTKMEFVKTRIEYLGLILSQGKIELQEHVLKALLEFPDVIIDNKHLQRFLGSLNYTRKFYEN
jgi:putative transposase